MNVESLRVEAPAALERKSFTWHRNATFAALLVGYAGYYLCRANLGVAAASKSMEPLLGADADSAKEAFGWIVTAGTWAYAFGKVAAGPIADARGGRAVFLLGLAGAVGCSLVFGLGHALPFFVVVWAINSLFQSMGWAGLVKVMSRWFAKKDYGTAMGAMSLNYQFGSALSQAFAGALLGWGLGWQALFFVPAILLTGIGLGVSPFLANAPEDVGHALPAEEASEKAPEEKPDGRSSFMVVLSNPMFWVMCGLSLVLTLMRRTFDVWLPTYFADLGAKESTAAYKSTVFPILGCVGTFATGWFSDRFLQGRRAPVMTALLVALSGSLFGLGHIPAVAHALGVAPESAVLGLVAVTGFLLYGAYSVVGGVAALDFGGKRAAGTAAGLLDGVGYAGAGLGGIGMAKVLHAWKWEGAFSIMAVLSLVSVGLCCVLWSVKPKE
jgi:sugar phosphate permease